MFPARFPQRGYESLDPRFATHLLKVDLAVVPVELFAKLANSRGKVASAWYTRRERVSVRVVFTPSANRLSVMIHQASEEESPAGPALPDGPSWRSRAWIRAAGASDPEPDRAGEPPEGLLDAAIRRSLQGASCKLASLLASGSVFEPEGRGFESLPARHRIASLSRRSSREASRRHRAAQLSSSCSPSNCRRSPGRRGRPRSGPEGVEPGALGTSVISNRCYWPSRVLRGSLRRLRSAKRTPSSIAPAPSIDRLAGSGAKLIFRIPMPAEECAPTPSHADSIGLTI